jgi:hypothetical protein
MKGKLYIIAAVALLPAVSGWSQASGVLKVKNRSTFTSVDLGRNPFWPVGYIQGAVVSKVGETVVQKPLVRPEDFTLTSISIFDGARMAMFCGKAVKEGDLVKVSLNGERAKVQIIRVADGVVVLRYAGQEITVPLKRTELDLISKPEVKEPVLHSTEE